MSEKSGWIGASTGRGFESTDQTEGFGKYKIYQMIESAGLLTYLGQILPNHTSCGEEYFYEQSVGKEDKIMTVLQDFVRQISVLGGVELKEKKNCGDEKRELKKTTGKAIKKILDAQ